MATTNFALLTNEQKTAWSMKFWRQMRNREFVSKFSGDSADSIIQNVTELRKDEKGARAVLTLIADSVGDGVAGDRQLEGNEEAIQSSDIVITMDQLRHAHRHEGRMADQKSVVNFRNEALNNLAYWMSDRRDQLAFLTLSGVAYTSNTDGSSRVGSQFSLLEYAGDVAAPSNNRYYAYAGADQANAALVSGASGGANNVDTLRSVDYKMLINLKGEAEYKKIKPIRTTDGISYYQVFIHPLALAKLKLDSDYLAAVRNAMPRSESNQLFKGTDTIYIDGLAITPYHHVFNTKGAASGSKWGATGTKDGSRLLFCGAQALGMADIGAPTWEEKMFDYSNQPGISVGKIFGFRKPKFTDQSTGTDEDFGVICVDHDLGSN